MLKIKTDEHGVYWIELTGECIHGGLTKQSALIYLESYQKIWGSGYKFAKEEDNCPSCSSVRCICAATNPFECGCGGWDDVNLEDYEE